VLGTVKTWLVPILGAAAAAGFATAMLAEMTDAGRRLGLTACGVVSPTTLCREAEAFALLPAILQTDGNRGAPMTAAFDSLIVFGHAPLLLIGTDTPHLPHGHLEAVLPRLPPSLGRP